MPCVNKQFCFLLPHLHTFDFFYLSYYARTSGTMLNRNGEGRHLSLVPDFRVKNLLSSLSIMLLLG